MEDTSGFEHDWDVDAGTVTWEFGPVEPGEGGEFQMVVETPPDWGEEDLVNMVDISAEFDWNEENNHAEATIYPTGEASVELHVDKYPSPGDPAPGSTYLYEIHYGNNGSVPTGQVTMTDTVPVCTSVVEWYSRNGYDLWTDDSADDSELVLTALTLPGGGWGDQIMLRLRVDEDEACPPGTTQLTNTVELAAEGAETVSQKNDHAWISDPYWNAHLEKNFGWGMLVPGGEIGYNLHVANHGNMTTTITLTDYLPAGTTFNQSWSWDGREYVEIGPSQPPGGSVSWEWGELPPGSWFDIYIQLDIDPALEHDTELLNCAEIMVAEGDDRPFDNESCRTDAIREPGPNLRIYKDYQWNREDQIQYGISFQNVGTETLHDVEIVDTLPGGGSFNGWWEPEFDREIILDSEDPPRWIIPELEPGWTGRIRFNADLDGPVEEGLSYINLAEAPVDGDKFAGDNIAEVTAYTGPDIWVEKWISGGEPRPGEIVTFTVQFGNRNQWPWGTDPEASEPQTNFADTLPDELTFVTATAPWDPGEEWLPGDPVGNTYTWDFGPMDAGSQWTFQIVAQVSEEAVEDEVIVNTVQAWSNGDDIDPVPANNTFHLHITILPPNYYIYLPIILKNH